MGACSTRAGRSRAARTMRLATTAQAIASVRARHVNDSRKIFKPLGIEGTTGEQRDIEGTEEIFAP
jgi:hypothetical protein